jgi:molybdate transport system permease protein
MMEADITAFVLTLKLAVITTVILLLISTPLALWLARSQWKYKFIIETLIALPLVLPPTVIGFYLLLLLGPNGPIGMLSTALTGHALAFTFTGLVIGSVMYSLPFVVQPLQNVFASLGDTVMEQAATLRAGPWDRFFNVMLPMARPGFLTAAVLGFAHTIGEFGVVLMIGGNIPGETQVISIAIYDHVESLEYVQAHLVSGVLLILSFTMLVVVYGFNRRFRLLRT